MTDWLICEFSDISITWNVTSKPAIFGDDVELSCYIGVEVVDCNNQLRQWIGGQHYTSLCQNMECSNDTKYHVKEGTPCVYTLIIEKFSMEDINCDYACHFGTRSKRMNLQLSHANFVCTYSLNVYFVYFPVRNVLAFALSL